MTIIAKHYEYCAFWYSRSVCTFHSYLGFWKVSTEKPPDLERQIGLTRWGGEGLMLAIAHEGQVLGRGFYSPSLREHRFPNKPMVTVYHRSQVTEEELRLRMVKTLPQVTQFTSGRVRI